MLKELTKLNNTNTEIITIFPNTNGIISKYITNNRIRFIRFTI